MSDHYRIYEGSYADGPVDYGSIVTETALLTYQPIAVPPSSEVTFAIRTYDTVTGLEELNTDARVRIVTDASGNDISNRPAPPSGLTASADKGGKILVEWVFLNPQGETLPTAFKVWITADVAPDYTSPVAGTVAYHPGLVSYSFESIALTDTTSYAIGVRATNASGDETNTTFVICVADSTGPGPVINLTGVPTY